MADQSAALVSHGAAHLVSVTIDTYNEELRDAEGFIGDRASKRAFQGIMDEWRERLRKVGDDPLGEESTSDIGKKQLDRLLVDGDVEAAGLVHGAIEEFAQELAGVIRKFLRLKSWKGTESIVVGGGLRASRVGELAIGRASVLLKSDGLDIGLKPIQHHPDEAGLIGAVHLAPAWIFAGHDSIVSVDMGGTNMRAGVVELNQKKAANLAQAHVMDFDLWRHRDDKPTREQAVERLGEMLRDLIRRAEKKGHQLAPFIGIGCPGIIEHDGSIKRGGQNLPGNWESSRFNLPDRVREQVPSIGGHETLVLLHNDAVVQGLSEIPFMRDVPHWGVLTIGTGLGNARFTNRKVGKSDK
jgi:predicted NBD/HSP70 family sugar kinase